MIDVAMRTTLDLDDDVLQAVKELATTRGTSAGRVASDLVRQALERPQRERRLRNGVPLLSPRPGGAAPVTMKRVNELRDA
jgi:hypothetical protein